MYSGDSVMPTMSSCLRRPLMMAVIRSPGTSPCASAKSSLTVTSASACSAGRRPRRSQGTFSSGSPCSGSETILPVTGSP